MGYALCGRECVGGSEGEKLVGGGEGVLEGEYMGRSVWEGVWGRECG